MTTLTAVLEKLASRKEDKEFRFEKGGFTTGNDKYYTPDDLTIIKTYRFEGESDPADSSILYLIEARDGTRGYSTDAYVVYSNHDEAYDTFIRKIKVEDRSEQVLFGDSL